MQIIWLISSIFFPPLSLKVSLSGKIPWNLGLVSSSESGTNFLMNQHEVGWAASPQAQLSLVRPGEDHAGRVIKPQHGQRGLVSLMSHSGRHTQIWPTFFVGQNKLCICQLCCWCLLCFQKMRNIPAFENTNFIKGIILLQSNVEEYKAHPARMSPGFYPREWETVSYLV